MTSDDRLTTLEPEAAARLVRDFAAAIQPVADVTGLYVGGSIAAGDFHAGISDFDLVALVAAPLPDVRRDAVEAVHRRLMAQEPLAAKLHCAYVPVGQVDDVRAEHPTWSHRELWDRHVTGVARAELLRFGITVLGPPPAELLPEVTDEALREAVRAELSGYWSGAVRKPHLWTDDLYVDLGLVTLARAQITLQEGRLATKREAIPRLAGFGVSPELVEQITRRRAGEPVHLGPVALARRAQHARSVVRRGIATLLAQ